jgi:DNA-binding transcriptional regulator YdaS (Cro superfamily)
LPVPRCLSSSNPQSDTPGTSAGGTSTKQRWTSPWYEAECARRTSRKEIAQELDIDYLASGESFFDLDVLQRLRAGSDSAGLATGEAGGASELRPPLARGELDYGVSTTEEGVSYRLSRLEWLPDGGRRRLSLWCPIVGEAPKAAARASSGDMAPARLRPRQDRNYVAFCDVAHGMGASNSVIKVADASTRQEVASFACPDTPPHELARYAVAICEWFGGQRRCLLGWEANGPGGIFGLEVSRMGYRAILGNPSVTSPWRPEDGGVGWQSSREKKLDLLGDLRRALARGELVLHDEATVTELEQYIYYPSGSVGPSRLVQEVEGARAAHGDRVIAAAGLLLCLAQQPGAGASGGAPPAGSFADRRQTQFRQSGDGARWRES